jgi:hypothetical protein
MVRLVSVAGDSGSRPGKDTWLRLDCCMLLFEDMLDIGLRGMSACSCLRWIVRVKMALGCQESVPRVRSPEVK